MKFEPWPRKRLHNDLFNDDGELMIPAHRIITKFIYDRAIKNGCNINDNMIYSDARDEENQ